MTAAVPAPDPEPAHGGSSQPYLDVEVARLRAALERYEDRRAGTRDERGGWQAATALVAAPDPRGSAIAFIRRTERPGDRWSGQMALPGGTRDPDDPDLATTAAREAFEEVGWCSATR